MMTEKNAQIALEKYGEIFAAEIPFLSFIRKKKNEI
jgi:hypothetical protein